MNILLETTGYILGFFLISGFLLDLLVKWLRYPKMKGPNSIRPATWSLPIVGHVWMVWGKPENVIPNAIYWYRKWKDDCYLMFVLHRVYVYIAKPEDYALTLGANVFTKKSDDYSICANSIMGQGIFSATDLNEWRKNRKLITPAFHFQILKSFIETFDSESRRLADIIWQKMEEEGEVEVHHPIGMCTLDMVMLNAMGVSINAQKDSSHLFIHGLKTACQVWYTKILKPWMCNEYIFNLSSMKPAHDKAMRDVQGFATQVILDKLEERLRQSTTTNVGPDVTDEDDEINPKKTRAFLDLLLDSAFEGVEDWRLRKIITHFRQKNETESGLLSKLVDRLKTQGTKLSGFLSELFKFSVNEFLGMVNSKFESSKDRRKDGDEKDVELKQVISQLRDEVITIMVGGQETTAIENSFVVLMLALHQEAQKKVAMELEDIFGEDCRSPTYADLQRMEYLECVINETMRLFPALPIIAREAQQDIQLTNKKVLPKGSRIACFFYGLHRDPRYFPDPDIFIPDRFLPENSRARHPYSFIPFAAGARNCIGQKYAMIQMKTILSNLVRRFKILPSHKMPSMESIRTVITPTLHPMDGCWVRLEKRV